MSDPHAHEGQPGDHGNSPEAQDRHNDLDTGAIAFIFIVGTVSVIAIVVALQVAYFWSENKLVESRVTSHVNDGANAVFAEQRAKQAGYAWVDKSAGVARIPIERAMDLVVTEQAAAQAAPQNDQQPASGGSGVRKGF